MMETVTEANRVTVSLYCDGFAMPKSNYGRVNLGYGRSACKGRRDTAGWTLPLFFVRVRVLNSCKEQANASFCTVRVNVHIFGDSKESVIEKRGERALSLIADGIF